MSLTKQLRQPEYTGEKRCLPCTGVNIGIAGVVSVLAVLVSPILGGSVFVLSLIIIYLRGYLVPGTPTLTKQYFPKRILRWFDKDATTPMADEPIEIDSERVLLDAGVVEPCREGTDLCLTTEFQEAWHERIHTTRARDPGEESLAGALDILSPDDDLSVDQHGDAFVAATDNAVIGQWGSQAAVVADIAAANELSKRSSEWATFAPAEISRVLMSLRIFLQQCPDCDGPVQVDQEAVESCCRSYDVLAATCQDCDARLFEIEWDDTDTTAPDASSNSPEQR
jgi:hypothetical protein